jgi:hypothetical protein
MCSEPDNDCPTSGDCLLRSVLCERANLFIRKDWPSKFPVEARMPVSITQGGTMPGISRRLFLGTSASFGAPLAASKPPKTETVFHFATRNYDVRMTVEFHDRYSSHGFGFRELLKDRQFCLSGTGEEGRNCLANFSGSVAIARYHIQPRSKAPNFLTLREHVRTIDHDQRLNERPPFERALEIQEGVVSDIQAFGYETDAGQAEAAPPVDPWCFLRQDLYLDTQSVPFLVIHWKHTLSAIRLLDVIPGDRTKLMESPL